MTRLIGRNPGPLADLLRGIETRVVWMRRGEDGAREALDELSVESDTGTERRALAENELRRATERLVHTQRQLYEQTKREKEYLDALLRNVRDEVAPTVASHLRPPTSGTSNGALVTAFTEALERRAEDERAWQRADAEMQRHTLVNAPERKAVLRTVAKQAAETAKRLLAISRTCARELAYEEKIANELPDDGVDEAGIIERCKATHEPTLKYGRVCREAEA